jgi:DsbC/DsbD-like thiol-disulfide interchange protein
MAAHAVTRYERRMHGARHCVRFAAAAAAFIACVAQTRAEPASAWSEDTSSAMRLIGGGGKSAPLQAGVEIRLQPGWHTYWRYPGDSGVPPQFDFSGSDNLKSAKVLYPAPHLHKDESGETIVYERDVIFPVEVTPRDAAKPVQLHLTLDYAVCAKMCVPAKGKADLVLSSGNTANPVLQAAEARVPRKVSAAAAELSVKRTGGGAKPQVAVDIPAPAQGPVTVLVEGPTAEWALPIPKPAAQSPPGQREFTFALDGLPPGADPSKPVDLTFTVIESAGAFEVTARLD